MPLAFDPDGAAVEAIPFDYPDDAPAPDPDPSRPDAGEAVARLLDWLGAGRTPVECGRRAIIISTIIGLPTAPKSCRALGRRLGMSHEKARQLLINLRSELTRNGPFSRSNP